MGVAEAPAIAVYRSMVKLRDDALARDMMALGIVYAIHAVVCAKRHYMFLSERSPGAGK